MKEELVKLKQAVDDGIAGNSIWVPIGFTKMGESVGIGQKIYTLIGGASGTGKTAFADLAYVLQPYSWFKKHREEHNIEVRWLYFSMERSKQYKLAKWAAIRLYLKYNILLDVPTFLGWGNRKNHIPGEIYAKVTESIDALEPLLDYIDISEGTKNPTGIYQHVKRYAEHHGVMVETPYITKDGIARTLKEYKPNNPRLVTIIVIDHAGKCKGETIEGSFYHPQSKQLMDKISDYCGSTFRDLYGFSPVVISQFNRGLEDVQRRVKTEMSPLPSDFKSTGNFYEDSDIALALYNPYKLGDLSNLGYNISAMVDSNGYNRFRSCYVLKNSYGVDDIAYGYQFVGEVGMMNELPKAQEITDYTKYSQVKARIIK